MTLHDHIQELRAELSRCNDAREITQIEHELRAAEADHAKHEEAFAEWLATLK